MNYELNIITRDMIPRNIYLCDNGKDEWNKINYFDFDNGFKCVIGASRYLSGKDAIESMKDEMDYVLQNESPEELQQYFYDNFENFINYSNCVKIYNYYYENEGLIKEVYYTYFDKEESNNDMEDSTDEEIENKELIEKYIQKYANKYIEKSFDVIFEKVANKMNKKC